MSDNEEATEDAETEDAETEDVESEDVETEDAETEDTEAGDEEQDVDGLGEGDFIEIDYTARTVEDDNLVDTTDPDVAEEEGVGEDREFGPRTIVVGEGYIFEAVEEDLYGKEVGDTGSVVVPAAEAFGEYDQDQVRTVSADKIPEDDRYPGAHINVDGQNGHLETIIGGRARVDFNHVLAGEDIEYEYEVVDVVEDREEQAKGLISMMLDVDLDVWFETETVEEERLVEPDEDEADEDEAEADDEEVDEDDTSDGDDEPAEPETETVEVEKDTLYVEAVPQLSMNQQWMMGKQQIAQRLIDQLGVDRIVVQETLEGMGGMGFPGMMGGAGGGGLEEALADADVDAEELAEEIESAGE